MIEGTQFIVDGEELTDLELGESVDASRRSVSGTLADGSRFRVNTQRFLESVTVRLTSLMGDFDNDGVWASEDIDSLCDALAIDEGNLTFDLNDDELLDNFDLRRWLQLAKTNPGDSNLDGVVNFADFLALSASFGQTGTWSRGDFDCDGSVGFEDFLVMAEHFGSGQNTVAVPEPDSFQALLVCLGVLSAATRRSRLR